MRIPFSRNTRLVVHLIVGPLLLIAAAWWLLDHARTSLAALPSDAQVQVEVDGLKRARAQLESGAVKQIRFEGDKMIYAGPAALQQIDLRIQRIESTFGGKLTAYRRAQPLARASIAASAAAIAVGVAGILMALWAGRAALRSREALAAVFDRTRRALPWLMAAQILLTAVAIFLLTGVVGWYAYETFTAPKTHSGMAKMEIYAIVVGLGATWVGLRGVFGLRRAFDAFEPTPVMQWGREVTEAQAPGLWQHVRSIASRIDARAPRNVVVGLTDGFYVTAHDVQLMPEDKALTGETLYLPLSCAALMRPRELDSIVGHELGHFSGDDTRYSLRFVPLHAGMARSMHALEASGGAGSGNLMLAPAAMLGDFLMERVQHAVAHWSRVREFAADQVGARVSGAAAGASALIRSSAIGPVIGTYLNETFRRPEDAPADLLQGLLDYARTCTLEPPDMSAEQSAVHPTDSHPPVAERVKALGVPLDDALMAQACAPADAEGVAFLDTLLPDRVSLQRQLSADVAQASLENKRAFEAELQHAVKSMDKSVEVRERVTSNMWAAGILIVMMLAVAIALAVVMVRSGQGTTGLGVGLGIAVVLAVACLRWALGWRKRGQLPVCTLTPTGIASRGLRAEVPWSTVADIGAHIVNGTALTATLLIAPDAPAPQLINAHLRRLAWNDRKRTFTIRFGRPCDYKPQELLELILDYRRAEHARDILADMKAPSRVQGA